MRRAAAATSLVPAELAEHETIPPRSGLVSSSGLFRRQVSELRSFVGNLREQASRSEQVVQYSNLLRRLEVLENLHVEAVGPQAPKEERISVVFSNARKLELGACIAGDQDESPPWHGEELEARLPKPGMQDQFRVIHLIKQLASEVEISEIMRVARTELEFSVAGDSVDQWPAFERYVIRDGQYLDSPLQGLLRPIVEERLLPFVRKRFRAPAAVVCTALVRRYLPGERRLHPTHLDAHAFCTAVLGLNPDEFDGGLYVQPSPGIANRQFVNIGRGDLVLHRYDLPHGVRVFSGTRYSLIFWIKDCLRSCLENSAPWYDAAAAGGDADAMAALAQRFDRGDAGERDPQQAETWYRRAAELGSVEAMVNLGALHEARDARRPGTADAAEALRWWRRAAEIGEAFAQRLLGLAYASGGCGLDPDDEQAAVWMLRAAEQDDAVAMYWLSRCFRSRNAVSTVEPAAASARQWLERAAEAGYPQAQGDLGTELLRSSCDLELGVAWLQRAAANGHGRSRRQLGELLSAGNDCGVCDVPSWLALVAQRGDPYGKHGLALLAALGVCGVAQDTDAALRWRAEALAAGLPAAVAMPDFPWPTSAP